MGEDRKAIVKRSQAKRRAKFKEMGLCVQCGKQPPIAGQTLCEECKRKTSVMQKRYYAKKKEKSSEKPKGKVICGYCKYRSFDNSLNFECICPHIARPKSVMAIDTCVGFEKGDPETHTVEELMEAAKKFCGDDEETLEEFRMDLLAHPNRYGIWESQKKQGKTNSINLCASCENGDYSPKDAGYICCSPCIIKEPSKTVATCIGYIER